MHKLRTCLISVTAIFLWLAGGCSTSDTRDRQPEVDTQQQSPPTPAIDPSSRITYYVGIIVKGERWTSEDTEESRATQAAHLKNIGRLADLGVLSLAGPFYEPGKQPVKRGLFFYRVPTMDSARELVRTDPAVESGQLAVQLYRWRAPEGMRYDEPIKMRAYVAALISAGPNWTDGQDWSYAKLMSTQHSKAAQSGSVRSVPIHGPFISSAADGQPLALILYDADSLQYVAPLLDATVDISSGILAYETMYWYGPAGLKF